jgi:hypothetical protein
MGLFGSLFGWDQTMAAVNAVLANHLIEYASLAQRKAITDEVVKIITRGHLSLDAINILKDLSEKPRVVQMNFVALACDNLHIPPPVPNNVWTRVKNPFVTAHQVTGAHISAAIEAVKKQDGVQLNWPGDSVMIDFVLMFDGKKSLPTKQFRNPNTPKSVVATARKTNAKPATDKQWEALANKHRDDLCAWTREKVSTHTTEIQSPQKTTNPGKPWVLNIQTGYLSNSNKGLSYSASQYEIVNGSKSGFEIPHGPVPWVDEWDVEFER